MKKILKKFHFGAILALFALVAINGCDNQEVAVSDEILDETAMTETMFAQMDADVEDAMPYDELSSGRLGCCFFAFGFGNCMTRTVERPEDARYPKVVTISYDSACTSGMNHTVKNGTIIITITGQPSVEGSQRIVTFENFSVNGYLIEGTKTITFMSANQWTSVLENGKITTPDGKVITRNAEHTRTQVAGMDTEERSDDAFEITGWASGQTAEGYDYSKEITEPLLQTKDCFWITKGIVEVTIGDTNFTIDFGDGTCDNLAVKTIDGVSEEFELEMKCRKMWIYRHRHQHQNQNGQ